MTTWKPAVGDSGIARALRCALATLLLGGTLLVALHSWLGIGEGLNFAIGSVVYDAVVLGAGVACLVRASAFGPERRAGALRRPAVLSLGRRGGYLGGFLRSNPDSPPSIAAPPRLS